VGGNPMTEAMVYDAYLGIQANGACLALIYDLPGCFARGLDEHEALERLTASIPAYFAWLRQHDDYTPTVAGPFRVELHERQRTKQDDAYATGVFFAPDGEPVSNEDLDWLLALLGWAYADLRDRMQAQEEVDLHSAGAASQAPLQRLVHLMAAQQWLLAMLSEAPAPAPTTQPSLATLHEWLARDIPAQIARFQQTDETARQQIIERDGVRWSMRKVLTRSILLARDYDRILAEVFGAR